MDYYNELLVAQKCRVKFKSLNKVGDMITFDSSIPREAIRSHLVGFKKESGLVVMSCAVNSDYMAVVMDIKDSTCDKYIDGVASRQHCLQALRSLKNVGDKAEFKDMNRNTLRGYIGAHRENTNLILKSCLVNDKYVVIAVGVKDE